MTASLLASPEIARRRPGLDHPPCLAVRSIRKSFPIRRPLVEMLRAPFSGSRAMVLRDVSVDIRHGELFGILGLNGAGKTTLLKILAGITVADGGELVLDRGPVPAAPNRTPTIVTAEERSLNWRLSARENLLLFAGLNGMDRRSADLRIAESLAAVELAGTARKLVGTFSSGMRQRLLVARGLLTRPSVLLLDEPTRSLDPLSAHAFRVMLRRELVERQGCTVVLATHNTEEAFDYCDRVAVLHEGSVAALGTARDLAARFVPDHYYIRTPSPAHPVFEALREAGQVTDCRRAEGIDGDAGVTCVIPDGEPGARRVLRALVVAGADVSRFERRPVALSALIRCIASHHPSPDMEEVARA